MFLSNATIYLLAILDVNPSYGIKSIMAEYLIYADNLYKNYSQNWMLDIAL